MSLVRERRIGLLGGVAYWGFDIAVLGLSLKAFGTTVPVAVLVMGYFLGTLGSLLPLPGGIGGVEGGMIGAFVAFGVPARPGAGGSAGVSGDLVLAADAARHRRLSLAALDRAPVAPRPRGSARRGGRGILRAVPSWRPVEPVRSSPQYPS